MQHPGSPFSSSVVLVFSNKEQVGRKGKSLSGQRCDLHPLPSPSDSEVPQEGAGALAGVITPVYTQPSGWYFCIFILCPSLWVFAQSEGAERRGGVEGESQGILAAGGPILVPPAQPSMETSGFQ